jgi:four helix bundle protein
MPGQNYRDLIVWQRAMDLVEAVYRLTQGFPRGEIYGLTSQMRRAAVSVPSNIAEGQGRGGKIEFARFLWIAHGSLREVETHLLISLRLKLAGDVEIRQLFERASEVGRLLRGLINAKKA